MKIISGGQTGVDRAALDAAIEVDLEHGGWCPKGRRAEDGKIGKKYNLTETPFQEYEIRTEWNVRDSQATLIITRGKPTGGTAFTIAAANKLKKTCLVIDLNLHDETKIVKNVLDWIRKQKIEQLNVAGPRESIIPGIYSEAKKILVKVFEGLSTVTSHFYSQGAPN